MSLLKNKKALVVGVANERSIAWGVAQSLHREGATIGLTYLNDAIEKRVRPLGEKIDCSFYAPCDVTQEEDLWGLKKSLEDSWGEFDILVHSLAFANREDLKGRFVETSREGFLLAMDISAYSLIALSQTLLPLMKKGGSIMAMTYLGAVKVVENYNVMGVAKAALECTCRYLANDLGPLNSIRVNAISAGPIKTLAASGVSGLGQMLKEYAEFSPLRTTIDQSDVGEMACFLASDHSRHITGQTLYVDAGASILARS